MGVINNNVFGLIKGEKGDTGKGLEIKKYYDSVEAMNADYSNADIAVGDSVAIKNTLDLCVKGNSSFENVGTLKGENGADGQDGATPEIGENGNWWIVDKDTGKPSRGATGATGATGADGATPEIGENGNWYINGEDTGKPSRGATGATGADGQNGAGVPAGGNAGQVLAKRTDADNDTEWVDAPTGGGSSGNSLQTIRPTFKQSSTWKPITWNVDLLAAYTWTDGENIYNSCQTDHYVLNKETSTWEPKTWNGLASFYGSNVWTDGENIYYSYETDHYVLNKETSTWEPKTWNGLASFYGSNVWTDGENIYLSSYTVQYVLNKETSTWEPKTWNGLSDRFISEKFHSSYIWTDGENIYLSSFKWNHDDENCDYVLDKETSTWKPKLWIYNYGILVPLSQSGDDIWTDGENIYYSKGSDQSVLNKETSTWEPKTWNGATVSWFEGKFIWTDGENIYHSRGEDYNYVLSKLIKSTNPLLKR